MGQRVYVKGKKTHAAGERFTQDNVGKEKERFHISVELMSLKTIKDYDIAGWVGEFYLRVDGPKMLKSRFPFKGVIKLKKEQTFTSKADMNIWSQFKTVRTGEESFQKLKFILREKDHLKKDQIIAEMDYTIDLPSTTKYIILEDKEGNTKAKLRIQAMRTRY